MRHMHRILTFLLNVTLPAYSFERPIKASLGFFANQFRGQHLNMKRRAENEKSAPLKISKKYGIESPDWFDSRRVRCLTKSVNVPNKEGQCVVYWMSRDQRIDDNWALLYSRWLASECSVPLIVVFNLYTQHDDATLRQYGFMLRGLQETEESMRLKHIPFYLLQGDPVDRIPEFIEEKRAVALITDMSPLRAPTDYVNTVATRMPPGSPLYQVDAHNIVPVWTASDKQEIGARTLRPKIHKLLEFLTDFPELASNEEDSKLPDKIDWDNIINTLEVDRNVKEVKNFIPGAAAARVKLSNFINHRLPLFGSDRNNPNTKACSDLSPYLNFGQLSAQRAVLEVRNANKSSVSTASYIEEAVVRRELSDNFCFYNRNYDRLDSAAGWARESLEIHTADVREYLYTRSQLEAGETHDDLWNAAQLQMVVDGKMHGFLRMYWAKKILEWTPTPSEALSIALYLNDKYELDGRDPNGYVGCAWSIMGTHDMGWTERSIFGKIRYMNYAGCLRKFDVAEFVSKYPRAVVNCRAAGGEPAKPKKARTSLKPKKKSR